MAFVQSNGIVTRPVSSKSFITAFAPGHESETIKPLGYPLSDLLINNQTELKQEFLDNFPELENKNVILYLPTYRRYEHMDLLDFDYEIDWGQLNKYLTETNSVFLVKRHPLQIHNKIEFVPKDYKRIIDLGDVSYKDVSNPELAAYFFMRTLGDEKFLTLASSK